MNYHSHLTKQKESVSALFARRSIFSKRYRKGGWTAKEVLLHIKDSETVTYDRLRRIIAEEKPILWYFEQDSWQKYLAYGRQDMELAEAVFLSTRDSIIEAVDMHMKKYGNKAGIHSRRGLMTMKELVEFHIEHVDRHIAAIKNL